jgi:hypothetical protein
MRYGAVKNEKWYIDYDKIDKIKEKGFKSHTHVVKVSNKSDCQYAIKHYLHHGLRCNRNTDKGMYAMPYIFVLDLNSKIVAPGPDGKNHFYTKCDIPSKHIIKSDSFVNILLSTFTVQYKQFKYYHHDVMNKVNELTENLYYLTSGD